MVLKAKDKPIRVAINAISLLSPLTGIGQYTYHLGRELEQIEGIEVSYFYGLFWSAGPGGFRRGGRKEQGNSGTGLWRRVYTKFKEPVKNVIPRPYELWRAVQQPMFSAGAKLRGIDVYHEPNFIPLGFGGPCVITLHDLSIIRCPETHPAESVRVVSRRLKGAVKRADAIIADSEFTRQEILAEYGPDPDKVVTVYPGVSRQYRPMTAAETRPVLAGRGLVHGRYILTVGTLEPRKNLPRLLRAYARLPERLRDAYPLVVVGMKGWHCRELERDLAALAEAGQLILAGYVEQEELPVLYAGAALMAYPSLYEGFGLPPLEAMASGTPVVVSNRSSMPEVVGDAGLMADPEDEQAIGKAMQSVLEDKGLGHRLAEAGLARAQMFSWEKCAEKTAGVYFRALKAG